MTAQFFANIACVIAVAAALAICIICERNRIEQADVAARRVSNRDQF